jgi:nucleoside-diphosphate-sugar epimerase
MLRQLGCSWSDHMDNYGRILVTGGTGFIGGRLVEVLAGRGAHIRVTTSEVRNRSRLAGLPVELVQANLLDHAALADAVIGCDVVFHFAYEFGGSAQDQQKANVEGTRALAEAFLKNGGRRFVHISSVSAYGAPDDGDLSEDTPPKPTENAYSNTKLKIDRLLRDLHQTRGMPVAIVQPTIVYGPFGSTWTTRLLEQVRSCRIVLPSNGTGLCNAVYVDDVVAASMLTAEADAAVGEAFLISGSSPTTWREFYSAYERMLGKQAILALDDQQMCDEEEFERRRNSIYGRFRRKLARSLWKEVPPKFGLPLYLPDPGTRALYAAQTIVRIDKARNKLGYRPAFDLDHGMALTREWAQRANLLSV